MAKELVSNWKRVATSGKTIDGRTIKPEWLHDIAETYDPKEYTAVINWEHLRFAGNFGHVVEVKAEEVEKGKTALFAKLAPNKNLLQMNDNGQKLFTSIEITPNYDDTGKVYLSGLAITDSPASLGAEMLKFSSRRQSKDSYVTEAEELGALEFVTGNSIDEEGLMRRIGKRFNLYSSPQAPEPANQEDSDMTKEQFAELQQSMTDAITQGFATLATQSSETTQEEEQEQQEESGTDFSAVLEKLDSIESEQKSLKDEFAKLSGSEVPGTTHQETTGAEEQEFLG